MSISEVILLIQLTSFENSCCLSRIIQIGATHDEIKAGPLSLVFQAGAAINLRSTKSLQLRQAISQPHTPCYPKCWKKNYCNLSLKWKSHWFRKASNNFTNSKKTTRIESLIPFQTKKPKGFHVFFPGFRFPNRNALGVAEATHVRCRRQLHTTAAQQTSRGFAKLLRSRRAEKKRRKQGKCIGTNSILVVFGKNT